MIGRHHAVIGAAASLATTAPHTTSRAELVLAGATAAGAAVAPDLDHPRAAVSKVLPLIGPLAARLVAFLAGGHRARTHTLEAAALATLGGWAASQHRLAGIITIAALVVFGAAFLGPHFQLVRAASLAEFAVGAAAAYALYQYPGIGIEWLPLAIAAGWISHLGADTITVAGIRPTLLARRRISLGICRTGSPVEALLGAAATVALVGLIYLHLITP